MKWRPIHKRTGDEYKPITDQERKANWSRPPYSTNFRFEPIEDTPKPEGVRPAKESETKAKKEITPETGNEKDLSNGQ